MFGVPRGRISLCRGREGRRILPRRRSPDPDPPPPGDAVTAPSPSDIAAAISWLVRDRREHGGRPTPPWPVDDLRALAAAARAVEGADALEVLEGLDVEVGADELLFGVAGSELRLDFGTTTSLIERGLKDGVAPGFVALLDRQPALREPTARALRGGLGAGFAKRGGDDLRHLLLQVPSVLEAAAEPGGAGRWAWLADLLAGDLRFLGLADAFPSPPARVAVLLAVGSPAAREPAERALEAWVDGADRPDKQALARLVDGSRQLGPPFLLRLVARRPELASALCRSERTSAWLHLDPEPFRALLRELSASDPAAAARALVGVGATDPHLANRILRGQVDLVRGLDGGFVEPHHRLYAWGATGAEAAVDPVAETLTALLATWEASKPVIDRSRALPPLLDHPCLSPWLLGALQERGVLELEELFVVLVRDPRGPGAWGEDPWPWEPPRPLDATVGERLVSWLCSSPPGRLTQLSAGPTGLSVSRLLELSALAWVREQVSLPVLLGLGASFGLGRAGPAWVAEAMLRFLDTLPDGATRREAAAELLDLLQPEPTMPSEEAVCDAVARALPAPVASPFVDFAVTRDWAARTGRAGELRERQAKAVLDAVDRAWRKRSPRRYRAILAPLFADDVAAVAEGAAAALRSALRAGQDPRWLVPAVLGGARERALDRLQRAMGDQRLAPELREATLEALQSGHPHPGAVDAALRRAGVGAVLRGRIVEASRDRILPGLLEGVLLDAVAGASSRSRLQRNTLEAVIAAHEDDPRTLARSLAAVLGAASWSGDTAWLAAVVRAAAALGEDRAGLGDLLDELARAEPCPRPLQEAAAAAAAAVRDPAVQGARQRVGRARKALVAR